MTSEREYAYKGPGEPDVEQLRSSRVLAFDCETTGVHVAKANLIGTSMTSSPGSYYYFPSNSTVMPLEPLCNPDVLKIAHNASFDRSVLKRHGIVVDNIIDTMIAGHMLNEETLALWYLAYKYAGMEVEQYKGLEAPLHKLSFKRQAEYSGPHSQSCVIMWENMKRKLASWGSLDCFLNVEMPLVPVISDMELNGAMIDPDMLTSLGEMYDKKASRLQDAMDYYSGHPGVNYRSGDQVAWLLFTKLGLPVPRGKSTKSGKRPSVNAKKVLEPMKHMHPVIPLIIMYTQYATLKSTYVNGILRDLVDGRIHTSFNQTGTGTSRLSSSGPNLQNIPKRSEDGYKIRRAFVAPWGYSLVRADWNQLELRTIAHASRDMMMLVAYLTGIDLHLQTALQVFGTASRRFDGKTLNFSTVYGGGDLLVAEQTHMPLKEARGWRVAYFEYYWGLAKWLKEEKARARENGYARTFRGRVRVIEDLKLTDYGGASDSKRVEHGYRQAISTVVQGSASEIVKLGMVRAWGELKHEATIKTVLQVHDELVYECPDKLVPELVDVLNRTLPSDELLVPLVVDIEVGKNWRDMVPYDEWAKGVRYG